jgi:hypothetical protein
LTNIDKKLIEKSFRQSILTDASQTIPLAQDLKPSTPCKQKKNDTNTSSSSSSSSSSSKDSVDNDDEEEDDELKPSDNQFESEDDSESDDEEVDSEDEAVITTPIHTYRHARAAHNISHNAAIARVVQNNF